jgi:putative ABC transport system permease protein
VDLALRDFQRHRGKFVATTFGVGLLVAIVLTMNGIYRGNIHDGVWLIENTDSDLWVVERGRGGPFNEPSHIPQETWKRVATVPGVLKASPYIVYTVQREIGGRSQQFTVVGYDLFGGLGGPGRLAAGRTLERPRFEMVADRKLGLAPGSVVRLGVHDFTVVGVTRGAVDSGGNPLVYLSLPDAQEVLYQEDSRALDLKRAASMQALEGAGLLPAEARRLLPIVTNGAASVSAVLVRLEAGANASATQRLIARWLYLDAFTKEEERQLMLRGRLLRMSAILGLFRVLLLIVAIVVISLLVYILTMEKIRSIATLKLIGAPNGIIVRLILEQSLLLTAASFGMGWLLIVATQDRFPRTLVLLAADTRTTFVVFLAGGIVASLAGIVHALRTPPSLALGG